MQYVTLMLVSQSAAGLGFLISAQNDNVVAATAIATAYIMPILIYCGLIVNLATLPVWEAWM